MSFICIFFELILLNLVGCSLFEREIEPADIAPTSSYFKFEDIKVQKHLKLDRGRSFVHDVAEFKVGTHYFSGNVEVNSRKTSEVRRTSPDRIMITLGLPNDRGVKTQNIPSVEEEIDPRFDGEGEFQVGSLEKVK